MLPSEASKLIYQETYDASQRYPSFHSLHESYAVLKEEVDELWEEIKKKDRDPEQIKKEAIQVGAMALRLLVDLC